MSIEDPKSLIGNWPLEMILLFNKVGDYCQTNGIDHEQAESMFNAGIVAIAQGRLDQFKSQ